MLAASLIGLFFFESVIGLTIWKLTPEFFGDQRQNALPTIFWAVLLSALILVVLRFKRIPLTGMMAIGIFYVFSVTILITISDLSLPWWVDGGRLRGMPWVTMWLMLVPVVVPLGHRRAIGRSFMLSIVPVLSMFAGVQWFGLPPAPVTAYLDLYIPCLIGSTMSVIIARMMYKLTSQVQ